MYECGFTGHEAADIAGISYRQLDYWARTNLVRPSIADAYGSGSRRRYSDDDLVSLSVVKALLDSGQRLESVRKEFDRIRPALHIDAGKVLLVISGRRVIVAHNANEMIQAINTNRGPEVVNVIPVEPIVEAVISEIDRVTTARFGQYPHRIAG